MARQRIMSIPKGNDFLRGGIACFSPGQAHLLSRAGIL